MVPPCSSVHSGAWRSWAISLQGFTHFKTDDTYFLYIKHSTHTSTLRQAVWRHGLSSQTDRQTGSRTYLVFSLVKGKNDALQNCCQVWIIQCRQSINHCGSYYCCSMSRGNITKAKLGNRVTSKEYFIVRMFSKKKTQKWNPQMRAKNSFLALWDTQGILSYRNIASTRQNVLINTALCFSGQKSL